MAEDPKVAIWDSFKRLPGGQQLVVLAFAAAISGLGVTVGKWATDYKVGKLEVQNQGLRNQIEALETQSSDTNFALRTPTCSEVGLRITGANERTEPANSDFDLRFARGTLPEKFAIWLVSTGERGSKDKGYWGPREATLLDGEWMVTIPAEKTGAPGESIHYTVFGVGEDGESLLRAYRKTMLHFSPEGDPPWPPLTETTSDIIACDQLLKVSFE